MTMRRRSTGAKSSKSGPMRGSSAAASNAPSNTTADADPYADLAANIGALTLDVPISNAPKPRRKEIVPFRFFDMPSELRLKVYEYYFGEFDEVLDLEHDNHIRYRSKLRILRTSRLVYQEASYCFYHTHAVRLFPIYGKYFRAKKPLLARMTPKQRSWLSTLELRLGPGWNKPPRGWVVNDALGLKECVSVRRVKVFVECDPSNDMFRGFRHSDGFYENFSRNLLTGVLAELPHCETVEFDANPSVRKTGAMMRSLLGAISEFNLRIAWGPEKGWDDGPEKAEQPLKPLRHGDFGEAMVGGPHVVANTGNTHGEHGPSIMVSA